MTENLRIDLKKNLIRLNMEGDSIVIEGTVERVADKKRALLLAMGIEGTSGVIDRLKVKPAKTMSDKEIYSHLVNAISEEPTLASSDIKIEVRDAVVDIEGGVGSLSHKRLMGVFAWWVPGSMEVINSLEVEPPEEDSDDEISDALRVVMEKDLLVDESTIRVSTKNWVVTLSGTVRKESEKEAAENDAWYVWGVNGVVNNIVVAGKRAG
ncbi:MAG: BON domain-containing protein [Deltaproteobacteria bacterium]|nr:BON domain-containing protein [Deltaproteobacteria bacterium]